MDTITLKNQTVDVVTCDKCGKEMVNLDAEQLAPGDLTTLKRANVLISNTATTDKVCVNCEFTPTFGHRIANWFSSVGSTDSDDDNDDDSSFFHSSGSFMGGSSFGGFSGGSSFGGFGGGGFSGGGASGGF